MERAGTMTRIKRKRPCPSTSTPFTSTPSKIMQLNYNHLIPGTILPPTFLQGKICIVWGDKTRRRSRSPTESNSNSNSISPNPTTASKIENANANGNGNEVVASPLPRIGFTIIQKYRIPKGYQPNDYVLPTETDTTETCEITIRIYHSQLNTNSTQRDADTVERVTKSSDEAYTWLRSIAGKEVSIETTGLEVVKKVKEEGKNVWDVVLQSIGQRELQLNNVSANGNGNGNEVGKQSKMLMPDFASPSQAPDWYSSSAPTVSSPPQPHPPSQPPTTSPPTSSLPTTNIAPSTSANTSKKGDVTKLRPITSFHPPDLTKLPSRVFSTFVNTFNPSRPNKRSSEVLEKDHGPVKRSELKDGKEISRPTVEQAGVPVSETDKDQHTGKGKVSDRTPRTVVQLGPPGFQALVSGVSNQPAEAALETSIPIDSIEIDDPLRSDVIVQPQLTDQSDPPLTTDHNQSHQLTQPAVQARQELEHSIIPLEVQQIQTPSKQMMPLSFPRAQQTRTPHAASSPYLSSTRRQSLPPTSQSSPVFASRTEREQLANARKQAEERRRGEISSAQAESSRAAQLRAEATRKLERPLHANGLEYTPLNSLGVQRITNIMGVVVKITHVSKPKDYMMSVVICDPTRHANGDPANNEELVVSIFRPTEAELPLTLSPGDVTLFRGVRITLYNNKTKAQAFSQSNNAWVILKNGRDIKLPNRPEDLSPPLTKAEVDRMVELYNWSQGENVDVNGNVGHTEHNVFGFSPAAGHASLSRNSSLGVAREEKLLGDIEPSQFFNAIFKIMHVNHNRHRKPDLELYITDGTISTNYEPRNFHNIEISGVPRSAIFSLAVHDAPPTNELPYFGVGNVLKLNNVRSKLYKGEMELSWSELPTSDQARQGWTRRRMNPIREEDERAKLIERRLRALKRGEVYEEPDQSRTIAGISTPQYQHNRNLIHDHNHPPIDPFLPTTSSPITARSYPDNNAPQMQKQEPRLATHIKTVHTDPTEHPISTIKDVITSSTIPNKYRIIARVKSIHSRNLENNDTLVQTYCKHCKNAFKGSWCGSCNDSEGEDAEYRYRFVCTLEDQNDGEDELACLVGDDEALEFLPPLPPYSTSTNPNDLRKAEIRRKELSGQVYNILQGAKMDGVRTKPFIDMSLEVYHILKPRPTNAGNGDGELGGEGEKIVVARMFGMTSSTIA
ncbi:uncharacterized protein I303_101482 [Kwoniella dejecticola CBS 10117]|uniref:Telomeric single stranded DNA binding POT1/Cdc13 domain-containing protein n=1 Tax=Kwoniella dejecticola CBS 10117 TaxID=1296121 RepID=A0AAJ8KK30_9TREE